MGTGRQLSRVALCILNTRFGGGCGMKHYHERREGPIARAANTPPPPFLTPLVPPTPSSENSPTTHRSKRMPSLMVGRLQVLPGKMGYLSSPSLCRPLYPLFSAPYPPGHSFIVSTFSPVYQVFDGLSPVQLVSPSLYAISRSTSLPALSSAGHLESHFSYCPPVTRCPT